MKNDIHDDHLKDLFKQMNLDEPTSNFESLLMSRIQKIALVEKKQKALKTKIINLVALSVGVTLMLVVSLIYFSMMGVHLSNPFVGIHFDPMVTTIGATIVALLMGDTLLRKKLKSNKNKTHDDLI